jgi:probable rRNA maturation factor
MEIRVEGLPAECGLKPGDIRRLVKRVLAQEKKEYTLAVVFLDDRAMSELNSTYKGREGPTDVLAFSMREGEDTEYADDVLGDIFISLDRAREQARELGHRFKDEIMILVLHGLLHLLGYDHQTMRRRLRRLRMDLEV